jgi:hypothetical protein
MILYVYYIIAPHIREGFRMKRIFGNRARIDLGSSDFRRFIENGNLYIDKTRFIEHVLQEASSVLLITRPRRSGKSMNFDTLRTFLDCRQDTRELFKGLYIENSDVFEMINKHPVVFLNLKKLTVEGYRKQFSDSLHDISD